MGGGAGTLCLDIGSPHAPCIPVCGGLFSARGHSLREGA